MTLGATQHLTLFDSIQKVLASFKFPYREGAAADALDVHLMLLDPSDGCYHAYLGSDRATDLVHADVQSDDNDTGHGSVGFRTDVINKLRGVDAAMLPELGRWISDNVRMDKRGIAELAIRMVRGEAKVADDIAALPSRDFRRFCSIVLSALPSHPTWDGCGYHRRRFADSAGTMAWTFNPVDKRLDVYSIKNVKAPRLDRHSVLNHFCDRLDERNRAAIEIDHKLYEDFLKGDCGYEEEAAYEAYHGPYDSLREAAFPGAWTNFLSRGLYLCSGLFGGMAFVPIERDVEWEDLFRGADDWRLELHRDLAPAVEKLWLAEFDWRMYRRLRNVRERADALVAFCLELNFLMPVEECLLVVGEREQFFGWRPRGVAPIRVFQALDDQAPWWARELKQTSSPYVWVDHDRLAMRIRADFGDEPVVFYILTREQRPLREQFPDYVPRFGIMREHTLLQKLQAVHQGLLATFTIQRAAQERDDRRNFAHQFISPLQTVQTDAAFTGLDRISRFSIGWLDVFARTWNLRDRYAPLAQPAVVNWDAVIDAGLAAGYSKMVSRIGAKTTLELRLGEEDGERLRGIVSADIAAEGQAGFRRRIGGIACPAQLETRWSHVIEMAVWFAVSQASYHAYLSTFAPVVSDCAGSALRIEASREEDRVCIRVVNRMFRPDDASFETTDLAALTFLKDALPKGRLWEGPGPEGGEFSFCMEFADGNATA